MSFKNRLSGEKSPYLLQHQANPVEWFPWGEEAFRRAKEEEKPIFLSIGYSTCYWCHVMEKDSFERDEVAAALNRSFICIKVDREERPDVDQLYMDAVIGLTGHGGWPMSVFLTPEGTPFYGGTYFPRQNFLHLLSQIENAWATQRSEVTKGGADIAAFLKRLAERNAPQEMPTEGELLEMSSRYERSFDSEHGGFGRAPKFPPAAAIQLLFRIHERTGADAPLKMATTTLEKMARGGIFDQIGGGFHRYSTDAEWLVPHFEKMLYDNALLVPAYVEGWQLTGSALFRSVAERTLDYVLREMTAPEGGFYCAQDAGEVGREGEFYVWREAELREVLTEEEFLLAVKLYGVTAEGNFEHSTNIFTLCEDASESSEARELRSKLLALREKRVYPHRDEKILAGWNGLMIGAFAEGHQAFHSERYLEAAQRCAHFLKSALFQNVRLIRRYCEGEARIPGTLEDYAYLIQGLLRLYESDFDPQWYEWAEALQRKQDELFWSEEQQSYLFAAEDPLLLLRKRDLTDNATPSANSVSALNVLRFFYLSGEIRYQERAHSIFRGAAGDLREHPTAFPTLFTALDLSLGPVKEVSIKVGQGSEFGEAEQALLRELREAFGPRLVVTANIHSGTTPPCLGIRFPSAQSSGSTGDHKSTETTFSVCVNQHCFLPTASAEEALKNLR